MTVFLFVLGLGLLVAGAEALVRGASRLAAALGVSPLVIGLTVVAFGTSAPELAVSAGAALAGQGGLALGNVVGSNIFNVLLILGVSALIVPLVVSADLVRRDVPLMIALSAATLALARDGVLSRLDGALLLTGLATYVGYLLAAARRERAPASMDAPARSRGVRGALTDGALVLVGLGALVVGARWLVAGAVAFAEALGVSETVIGLTIVAAGTSLPEVVTSVVASVRGARDIAVGNVVGSNLFNLMGVLGLAGVLAPDGVTVAEGVLTFDLPVMLAVAVACLPVFFTGGTISRGEGAVLLGYYVAYTAYAVLGATGSGAQPGLGAAMLYFVLPLTALTLVVLAWQEHRRRRRRV
ncbi:MAG: calcium/sodium antiporter [Rubricoccaceae bacterium]